MELCKHLIDELNADHTRGALPPTPFSKTTLSMHFYDSMAIFEKGRHLKKHAPQIGSRGTTTGIATSVFDLLVRMSKKSESL